MATLNNLCLKMMTGRSAQSLEERKCHSCIFKNVENDDVGNYRVVSLLLVLGKVMEQIILEKNISRLRKEKKIIRSSPYRFTNEKSCFINLINFCGEMTGSVDEGRAVDGQRVVIVRKNGEVLHWSVLDPTLQHLHLDLNDGIEYAQQVCKGQKTERLG